MYAVIATGGKQEKVSEGQVLDVELLAGEDGGSITFTPILVVDGDRVISTSAGLVDAKVVCRLMGQVKGRKIRGFTYKNKSNQSKRWGHRQKYTRIEITSIIAEAK